MALATAFWKEGIGEVAIATTQEGNVHECCNPSGRM